MNQLSNEQKKNRLQLLRSVIDLDAFSAWNEDVWDFYTSELDLNTILDYSASKDYPIFQYIIDCFNSDDYVRNQILAKNTISNNLKFKFSPTLYEIPSLDPYPTLTRALNALGAFISCETSMASKYNYVDKGKSYHFFVWGGLILKGEESTLRATEALVCVTGNRNFLAHKGVTPAWSRDEDYVTKLYPVLEEGDLTLNISSDIYLNPTYKKLQKLVNLLVESASEIPIKINIVGHKELQKIVFPTTNISPEVHESSDGITSNIKQDVLSYESIAQTEKILKNLEDADELSNLLDKALEVSLRSGFFRAMNSSLVYLKTDLMTSKVAIQNTLNERLGIFPEVPQHPEVPPTTEHTSFNESLNEMYVSSDVANGLFDLIQEATVGEVETFEAPSTESSVSLDDLREEDDDPLF